MLGIVAIARGRLGFGDNIERRGEWYSMYPRLLHVNRTYECVSE